MSGGTAGVAALWARELGAEVAPAERGTMGGTYTNGGCVPTRELARPVRLVRDAVLGAHNVGEQAVEGVQAAATAIRVDQLATLELAYPTFTAVVGLAERRITRNLGLIPSREKIANAPEPQGGSSGSG